VTRLLRLLAGTAAGIATLATLMVTHLPGPSAVGSSEADPNRVAMRGVWEGLRDVARHLPAAPELLKPLLSDKTIHVVIYIVPAGLWALSLGRRLRTRAWLLWAACATWGALDEGSQALAGRDGEFWDWVANAVGATIGIALAWPVASAVSRFGDWLRGSRAAQPDPPAEGLAVPGASAQNPSAPRHPATP
jgi:hypothetical protein